MFPSLALAEIIPEVGMIDWCFWGCEGEDLKFLGNQVQSMEGIVSLELDFGKVQGTEGSIVVFKGGRVLR